MRETLRELVLILAHLLRVFMEQNSLRLNVIDSNESVRFRQLMDAAVVVTDVDVVVMVDAVVTAMVEVVETEVAVVAEAVRTLFSMALMSQM